MILTLNYAHGTRQMAAMLMALTLLAGCAALQPVNGQPSPLVTDLENVVTKTEGILAAIPGQTSAAAQTILKGVVSNLTSFASCVSAASLTSPANDASAILACGQKLPVITALPANIQLIVGSAVTAAQLLLGLFGSGLLTARAVAPAPGSKPSLPLAKGDRMTIQRNIQPRIAALQAAVNQ
jgi:hypothetical protein